MGSISREMSARVTRAVTIFTHYRCRGARRRKPTGGLGCARSYRPWLPIARHPFAPSNVRPNSRSKLASGRGNGLASGARQWAGAMGATGGRRGPWASIRSFNLIIAHSKVAAMSSQFPYRAAMINNSDGSATRHNGIQQFSSERANCLFVRLNGHHQIAAIERNWAAQFEPRVSNLARSFRINRFPAQPATRFRSAGASLESGRNERAHLATAVNCDTSIWSGGRERRVKTATGDEQQCNARSGQMSLRSAGPPYRAAGPCVAPGSLVCLLSSLVCCWFVPASPLATTTNWQRHGYQ